MSKPVELIIFDCDGVLIDSEAIACRIEAEALIAIGCPVTIEEAIISFTGRADAEVYGEIKERFGITRPADYDEKVEAALRQAFQANLKAVDGIHDFLAQNEIPRCVASGSSVKRLEFTLGLTGLHDIFAPNIFSAQMVAKGKPAPDVFLLAANKMGVAVANCLVIEDSISGVKAARAAEMRVWGFIGASHCQPGHAERLLDVGAELIFDDMVELPSMLMSEI